MGDFSASYERAFRSAVEELTAARKDLLSLEEEASSTRLRISKLEKSVEALSALVESGVRREILASLEEDKERRVVFVEKGTPEYKALIETIFSSEQTEWAVTEVSNALERIGFNLGSKETATMLGRLAKRGVITRVGRGRYHVPNANVVDND